MNEYQKAFEFELRGLSFRPRLAKELMAAALPQQEFILEPDPDNPYDSDAIKVIFAVEGKEREECIAIPELFVGFVPRELTAIAASYMKIHPTYRVELSHSEGKKYFLNFMVPQK